MCGIVGYLGSGNAIAAVVAGLKSLEYRGYDSAGCAWREESGLKVVKTKGRVVDLEAELPVGAISSEAIGHTRWATHGAPLDCNAHPHFSVDRDIVLVHNGIIDNYLELRAELIGQGFAEENFTSDTDSEVIVQLIASVYAGDLLAAVELILPKLDGAYALAVMAAAEPGKIIAARKGSPLAIGIGEAEVVLGSDAVPILPHTNKVIFLDDNQVAICTYNDVILRQDGVEAQKMITEVDWSPEAAQKGGYKHFMLKEIFEQPQVMTDLIRQKIELSHGVEQAPIFHLEDMTIPDAYFKGVARIVLVAQGTAYHAGMIGRNLIERTARIPSYAEYAADFHYRDPILDPSVLVIAITQSGETMDTLHAVRSARAKNCKVISIVNTVGSTIARESDGVFYMHCGPEIGVASTKAFTSMIASLYILSLKIAQVRGTIETSDLIRRTKDLLQVGPRVEAVLSTANYIKHIALKYKDTTNFLFLGRGTGWPIAMEGALKLKEVSYIHAEGYDAAEMKHGPIALIDENMPCLFIALKGRRYDKVISNIQEVKARGGRVIAIASHDDNSIADMVDDVIYVRAESGIMNSIVCSVPLQLLAYYIAEARGCDVDKPKNLAKSVTVE